MGNIRRNFIDNYQLIARNVGMDYPEEGKELQQAIEKNQVPEPAKYEPDGITTDSALKSTDPIGPKEQGLDLLERIEKTLIERFAGRSGYNPYIYIKEMLSPLKKRIQQGDLQAVKEVEEIDIDDINPEVKTSVDKGLKMIS
jgi:hypothetical protein